MMSFSKELNQLAADHPQVGDYWSERMCPYFIVVDVQSDAYTILCCFPNDDTAQMARIRGKDSWQLDYSKHSVVSKKWIDKTVHYSHSARPTFVADVNRDNEKMLRIVAEWREANPNYTPVHVPFFKQYAEWWLGA